MAVKMSVYIHSPILVNKIVNIDKALERGNKGKKWRKLSLVARWNRRTKPN